MVLLRRDSAINFAVDGWRTRLFFRYETGLCCASKSSISSKTSCLASRPLTIVSLRSNSLAEETLETLGSFNVVADQVIPSGKRRPCRNMGVVGCWYMVVSRENDRVVALAGTGSAARRGVYFRGPSEPLCAHSAAFRNTSLSLRLGDASARFRSICPDTKCPFFRASRSAV